MNSLDFKSSLFCLSTGPQYSSIPSINWFNNFSILHMQRCEPDHTPLG